MLPFLQSYHIANTCRYYTLFLLSSEVVLVEHSLSINEGHKYLKRIADFNTSAFLDPKEGAIYCMKHKRNTVKPLIGTPLPPKIRDSV